MKNYAIIALTIFSLVLISNIYKDSKTSPLDRFPIDRVQPKRNTSERFLYLFIFFSRYDCAACREVIALLNQLPPPFLVNGIVPAEELDNEADLRNVTGASFKLLRCEAAYKKFIPHYSPSIFGVSETGKILFILPAVPGENEYIYSFLTQFYSRSFLSANHRPPVLTATLTNRFHQ